MADKRSLASRFRPDKPRDGGTIGLLDWLDTHGTVPRVCQQKIDGQRVVVTREGVFSRNWNPVVVEPEIQAGIDEALSHYGSDEVALDGEHVSLTQGGADGPGLWLFDTLVVDGKWQGETPYEERLDMVFVGTCDWITTPHQVLSGFVDFYEQQRGRCEGVVVKNLDSHLRGGTTKCLVNSAWVKLRYDDEVAT